METSSLQLLVFTVCTNLDTAHFDVKKTLMSKCFYPCYEKYATIAQSKREREYSVNWFIHDNKETQLKDIKV